MLTSNLSIKNEPYLEEYVNSIIGDMYLVCQISADGKYINLSNSYFAILGYENKDLIGNSWFDFIHPDDTVMVKSIFNNAFISGEYLQTSFRYRYRCKNNSYVYLESNGFIIYDRNNLINGVALVTYDITQRIDIESKLIRLCQLKTVGQLNASMIHEIRNPITIVKGILQVLGSDKAMQQHQEYFEIMISELDGANRLITEYLTIAKEKPTEYYWQDLNSLIESLYPIITAEAMMTEHVILLDLGEIEDIFMDSNQIRQLLLNLVSNGLESMEKGGILTIRTTAFGDNTILAVEDQGRGIKEEVLDKIGTPFFTTKEQGTGLGLSICKNIAAGHNADIKVKSSEKGTIFSVIFKNINKVNYSDIENEKTILDFV